ncbi:hypothetical protein [Chryseobacterium oranimense]|uniref:hypothetical protein n=1 Tax=Chryseobacterium oranimense TaxID=421058 RepID=UPI0005959E94|nr:hypothetical protein [Chryseobacterium oranimense]
MLLGLAFSNNNANTTSCNSNQTPTTVQLTNPGEGLDPGDGGGNGNGHGNGGNTGGNTGQTPPSP